MRFDARRFTQVCILFAATALCGGIVSAQQVIKLGTIAPEGSAWHDGLLRIRQAWRDGSDGKVELRIYAGGVLGGEDELVRKLQRRVIDAVTLSGSGLPLLDHSFDCLNIPLLFDGADELDHVRDRIAPAIEQRLEQKGFKVLNWAIAGWVHFFTREPARVPDDLRRQRLWIVSGRPELERLYKDFGLRAVPLPVTDMLTGLQTGLIDATTAPPLFALLDRSYQVASHMTDLNWGALNAATVVSTQAWARVPATARARLLETAREAGGAMRDVARRAGDDAVKEMQSRGLTIVELTDAERVQWRAEAEKAYPALRGAYCPAELFDEVLRLSREFRGASPAKAVR
jgi:TRAP-type C4-dicarboxylate transport system substrate-binding protein